MIESASLALSTMRRARKACVSDDGSNPSKALGFFAVSISSCFEGVLAMSIAKTRGKRWLEAGASQERLETGRFQQDLDTFET